MRVPPFTFTPRDGYSFLKIKSLFTREEDAIIRVKGKDVYIIPTGDGRVQIIIVPLKSVDLSTKAGSMCEQVRHLVKDIDSNSIEKMDSVTIPSFEM